MLNNIEAIIISEDHYNALGVIRSLGVAGIPIHLILTSKGHTFSNLSRYITSAVKIERNESGIIHSVNVLAENASITYALFPLSDFAAQTIDAYSGKFGNNLLIPNMNGEMRRQSDKYLMKMIAREYGLCVPEGLVVNLPCIDIKWNKYPAIIKPLVSVEGAKGDIVTITNKEELIPKLVEFAQKGYNRVLLEEFIHGSDEYMVEVLGERTPSAGCQFSRIIKKIREFPISNGSTSYAVFVDEHEGVCLDKIEKMLENHQYCGLFDVEYKYANGKLYFIECNFRNGAPGWAVTLNGINLPLMWIADALGVSADTFCNQSEGNVDFFMFEQNDIINMLKHDVSFATWLSNYKKSKKCFWYRKDIKPVVAYYILFIAARFHLVRNKHA